MYFFERQASVAIPEEPMHQRFQLPMVPPVPPPVDVAVNIASSGYFAAVNAQLLAGAIFPAEPVSGSCDTAVITREAAEAHLPAGASWRRGHRRTRDGARKSSASSMRVRCA